jgi:chromosome segregation ATPase
MLLEIEKAKGIIDDKKAELKQEITQTMALQIELDMTAEQFGRMDEERAQGQLQWESTVKQMQALNAAIEMTTGAFETCKAEVEKLHSAVTEETKKLDLAQSENSKIERQVTVGDHQISQRHRIQGVQVTPWHLNAHEM